ncbi:MAG: ECF transporter S component [Spirochaetaceae bacterium]
MQRTGSSLTALRARILERSPTVFVVAVCLGMLFNTTASAVNTLLSLPLFFDTVFTMVVAALCGPVAGVVTGLGSNVLFDVCIGGPGTSWPFGVINAANGLIVGMSVQKRMFRYGSHVVIVAMIAAVSSALFGAVVAHFFFGGTTGFPVDSITHGLLLTGKPVFWAAFLARIPVNAVDKAIAVLAAFLAYRIVFVHGSN